MKNVLKFIKILSIIFMFSFVACDQAGSGSNDTDTVLKSDKAITAFDFTTPAAIGVVDEATFTVAVTVPFKTDVTALVPTILYNGANITPDTGVAVDFTAPVTYTVEADDGTTQDYIVTVTIAPVRTEKAITAFDVVGGVTTIDEAAKTIAIAYTPPPVVIIKAAVIPPSVSLTPTIECSPGASVSPASGVAAIFTYGSSKTYTVTAEDGLTQDYKVTVQRTAKAITAFNFKKPKSDEWKSAIINEAAKTVSIVIDSGEDAIKLDVKVTVSSGASSSPSSENGVKFTYDTGKTYTVTAEDGSTQAYVVTAVKPI